MQYKQYEHCVTVLPIIFFNNFFAPNLFAVELFNVLRDNVGKIA